MWVEGRFTLNDVEDDVEDDVEEDKDDSITTLSFASFSTQISDSLFFCLSGRPLRS